MGHRAECVMLNKGPHIVRAVEVLDDILRRMQTHQKKKRRMLRELRLARSYPEGAAERPEPSPGIGEPGAPAPETA
jgi:pyruvate kinase